MNNRGSVRGITLDLARELIKIARESIERRGAVERSKLDRPELSAPAAVFVTLERLSDGRKELRGCIGFIEPMLPLWAAVVESAISSAYMDPRFPPVRSWEMSKIVISLTILGAREPVKSIDEIVIGRDALYVERKVSGSIFSGILLPEVPVERCWDKKTFADATCMKAGLEESCWEEPDTVLYRIPAITFREREPGGEVEEADLMREYSERCRR